ncbi:MAG: helix-turn-helix domain-containing protein [Sciscionella sp.]
MSMGTRRDGLVRRRAARGFTQESLAERLEVERSTVARWERGVGTPQPWSQPRLAKALDISLGTLADLLGPSRTVVATPAGRGGAPDMDASVAGERDQSEWLRSGALGVVEPPWSLAGMMRVLHEMAGGPMDRRGFLVITGATLTGVADRWGATVARPQALPEPYQGRLTPAFLDQLDHRLGDLRRLDDAVGGRELRQLAVAEFRWLTQLADDAVYTDAAGQRLFSLITEAARICGWLHFDAGQHAAAQSYYVTALRASATANDTLTGANVLQCMSLQSSLTGHPTDAVSLIEAAEQRTKYAATPRLKALFASRKAKAYARARDAASCGRALTEAERCLDTATSGTSEPDWLYFFDEAQFAAQAASSWVDLHQPTRARPLLDNALSSMAPHYIRDRAIYYGRSAHAHVHAAELDPACDDLLTAADLARQTGSMNVLDAIRDARAGMSRYDDEPRVQELDHHLADLST